MRDIATLKGYLFQTADKNWIYGISEASELVRVSYSGKIETLFADRTGLLRSLAEKEHAPIYLADGCTLFFLAGTDEGIGIYRLYLPNKQADVLYSSIPRNALRLRLEPPPSNVEAVWDNGDVLFFARYEELLNTSSGYAPEAMGEDECNRIPNAATCRSLELGMIRCLDEISEQIRRSLGLSMTAAQIESVLRSDTSHVNEDSKKIIHLEAERYTKRLLSAIAESGLDVRAMPAVFLGGGAALLKRHVSAADGLCRPVILDDVSLNAKGYEWLTERLEQKHEQ